MAEKELRRLKRRDLLQMLVAQCEETERLQLEADQANAQLTELEAGYERLKDKLNKKDEKLNQKDARIAELEGMIEELKMTREIELEEAGSIAEAALRLNGIFEAAQEAADQYLMNVKKMADAKRIAVCKPSVTESKIPTVVPVNPEERKKTHKYGWVQDNQRKLIHG